MSSQDRLPVMRRGPRAAVVVGLAVAMLVTASPALAGTTLVGTISLGAGTTPTGITANGTNHIAYVAESGTNKVAAISGYTSTSTGSATALASGALPNLDFPDNLALDSEGFLYAANFCANLTSTASHSLCPSGTPSTDVASQSRAGTYEVDVVKVSTSATGGSFTLSFLLNGVTYTTGSIAYNASAAAVATAFTAAATGLTAFPSTGVTTSGTNVNTSSGVTVTFQNGAYGPVTNQTVTNNTVTGGTPTFTRTTDGTYNSSNGSIALNTCDAGSGTAVTSGQDAHDSIWYVGCAGTKNTERCDLGSVNPPFSACTSFSSTTLSTSGISSPANPVPSGVAADSTNRFDGGVLVADAANSTIQEITTSGSSTPVALAGCEPANVAVTGSHNDGVEAGFFVACPGTGTVVSGALDNGAIQSMFDTATSLGSHGSPTGCNGTSSPAPYGVATNASVTGGGSWQGSVVVTDSANNYLDVYTLSGFDTEEPTLSGPTCVATGSVPDGVAMDGNLAFVANEAGNSVTVIDPPTGLTGRAPIVKHPKSDGGKPSSHPLVAPLPAADVVADRGDTFRTVHHRRKLKRPRRRR